MALHMKAVTRWNRWAIDHAHLHSMNNAYQTPCSRGLWQGTNDSMHTGDLHIHPSYTSSKRQASANLHRPDSTVLCDCKLTSTLSPWGFPLFPPHVNVLWHSVVQIAGFGRTHLDKDRNTGHRTIICHNQKTHKQSFKGVQASSCWHHGMSHVHIPQYVTLPEKTLYLVKSFTFKEYMSHSRESLICLALLYLWF